MFVVRTVLFFGFGLAILWAITRLYMGWSYARIGWLLLMGAIFCAGVVWLYKRTYEAGDDL